ncbi:hypothetical protein ACFE04_026670 [Oxalis oulophora]
MAIISLAILLIVSPAVHAMQYTVGGTSGWNQGVVYDTWVSGKTFNVGDTLLFTYTGLHSVDVLSSKSDYDACSSSNTVKSYTDGNSTIPLDKAGSIYFICPTSGHCANGMKLAITVASSSTTPTTPSTGSGTTASPPPPPPSGASNVFNVNSFVLGTLVVIGVTFGLLG